MLGRACGCEGDGVTLTRTGTGSEADVLALRRALRRALFLYSGCGVWRTTELQADEQLDGVGEALRAALAGGAPGLEEAALEEKVKARHAAPGAGGAARNRKRLDGRRNALVTADGAFVYSQSHWRRLV